MYEFELNLTDPSKNSYYFPIIVCIVLVLFLIQMLIILLKQLRSTSSKFSQPVDDKTFANSALIEDSLRNAKDSLKSRYIIAFILTRSAMWAKAPYLYTLFMTVHKFSMSEIGILYFIDAIAALIFGPLTGRWADTHGRKLFCHCYNWSIILNLLLRMEGHRVTAYIAQVVTGFGAGLICTTFEAWVVDEAAKIFDEAGYKEEKERFLKRLFKNTNVYDAVTSIVTSAVCAVIYSIYGIYAPFWISIFLSFAAFVVIAYLWDENAPAKGKEGNAWGQFMEAGKELRKMDVLCVGLMEGLAMGILNIYLFSWTPILKMSTKGGMNAGFIYTCMVLTMIIGTKTYEVLIVNLNFDYYCSLTGCLFVQALLLFLIYWKNSFTARLIFFSLLNGSTGFYNPLNSIVKSEILIQKYRALLMNIFRIPLNIYVIVVLLTLRYMNPFTVAVITAYMAVFAGSIGVFLVVWQRVHKDKGEEGFKLELSDMKEKKVDIKENNKNGNKELLMTEDLDDES